MMKCDICRKNVDNGYWTDCDDKSNEYYCSEECMDNKFALWIDNP